MANRSTGIYGHFGSFSATNQLPNVAGADVQTSEVQVGDLAAVAGALYICTTATLGAAVWAAVGAATPQVGYAYSGTHATAVKPSAAGTGETRGLAGRGPLGVSRVGAGAGAPSAGDTVCLFGAIGIMGAAAAETFDFTIPYELAFSPFAVFALATPVAGASATATFSMVGPTTARLTVGTMGSGTFPFTLTYQAANAVGAP